MAHTIVLGGGLCGLTTAMMLTRDGHLVTVLERDPDPLPADPEAAWERWRRDGVAQFRQAHYLQPLGRQVLDAELPDVRQALEDAGALRFSPLDAMPPSIADRSPRPGDERFVTWTGRRSTIELAVGRAASVQPGLELRRGVSASALETRRIGGRVHVTAVRTGDGERLPAELVVDAMGRGSTLPKLLAAAGGDPIHEVAEDSGFLYYTRYFRGEEPAIRAALNSSMGSFSILTLPGDAGTWSVTLYGSSRDPVLKAVRDPARWTALVRACPRQAHWLEGEPITGVMSMGGILNRQRTLSEPGAGVVSVGDAWATVDPSTGRGMSLGLAHAALLRRVVRSHGEDPVRLVAEFAAATEAELAPWYQATADADRVRLAEIDALRLGLTPPAPVNPVVAALGAAMSRDPDIFRAGLEIVACLALPQEVFARPGLAEQVLAYAADGPRAPAGLDRQLLLALVG